MTGTDKEPIGSISVCVPACEGESSILDQSAQEADCQKALDYAKDVYKSFIDPPLASMHVHCNNAIASFNRRAPGDSSIRKKIKNELYDFWQTQFKDALKKAHEEAFRKALAAFESTIEAVGGFLKQEYKRRLDDFMTNEYEVFEESHCRRAMEHAAQVYFSALDLNPPLHTLRDTVEEPIGCVSKRKNQSVEETNRQNALDHAKDVYKTLFNPPIDMLSEARKKALDVFDDVARGVGGPGSIRENFELILRDIMYQDYKDAIEETHEEAALKALEAFDSEIGTSGCNHQQEYRKSLEDFMRNQHEGFEAADWRRIEARAFEIMRS